MAQAQRLTKILDGDISLGYSNLTEGTITVDGKPPPKAMEIDLSRGTVRWKNQNKPGDRGPYLFAFDYEPITKPLEIRRRTAYDPLKALEAILDHLDGDSTTLDEVQAARRAVS